MELQSFISTAIVSIVRGVEDAQLQLKESKATVNPEGLNKRLALENLKDPGSITNVEFEVTVEVKSTGEQGGSVGIQIAVFKMGLDGKASDSESHFSRLRFCVPLLLPPGDLLKPELRLAGAL